MWWGVRKAVGSLVALRKESVDRNCMGVTVLGIQHKSLSARRAWIEIMRRTLLIRFYPSLSARRAWIEISRHRHFEFFRAVALRKESVDRNCSFGLLGFDTVVALRKESVDRN